MHHTIRFGQTNIFVKRIPVTAVEYDNLFSTKNFYNLPTSCHYGVVGSPGFGGFRELVTHLKTTHWVLAGEVPNFPLMYHYRLMPVSGRCENVDMEPWGDNTWGGNTNVRKYVLDRVNASHELVLFLEHIPHVLETWLEKNPNTLQRLLNHLRKTIAFLRNKGLIHFDAHFRNILTDGDQIYLTDFGLVLDKHFALAKAEASFFEENTLYDYGEILRNLGHLIRAPYELSSGEDKCRMMEKYSIKAGLPRHEVGSILLDNIEQISAEGDLQLDQFYVNCIVRYRSIITLMQGFFSDLWGNNNKDTKLPHARLQRLLKETDFLADDGS
ncbi:MAG: hypothetical protein AAGF01_23885 [Cyanobacteria bacterium P01_G01_bin.38]